MIPTIGLLVLVGWLWLASGGDITALYVPAFTLPGLAGAAEAVFTKADLISLPVGIVLFLGLAGPATGKNTLASVGMLVALVVILFIAPGLYSPLLIQIFMAAVAVVAAKILKLAR